VTFAARRELAETIADVLLRRTHIAWTTPDHGRGVAGEVAGLLADELGWDAARSRRECERLERTLAAEGL